LRKVDTSRDNGNLMKIFTQLIFLVALTGVTMGANIISYDPSINDIENAPFDVSGVGRSGSNWGTLIYPNIIISSAHWVPSGQITFLSGESRTITGGQRMTGTDMWVGILDEPVTESRVYDFSDIFVSPSSYYTFLGNGAAEVVLGLDSRDLVMVAKKQNNDPVVAYGLLSYFVDHAEGAAVTIYRDSNSPPGSGILTSGDSGSPAFGYIDGVPTLIGTGWRSDSTNTTWWSYTGNAAHDIDAFIEEYGETIVLPEPTRLLYLLVGLGYCCLYRRRL